MSIFRKSSWKYCPLIHQWRGRCTFFGINSNADTESTSVAIDTEFLLISGWFNWLVEKWGRWEEGHTGWHRLVARAGLTEASINRRCWLAKKSGLGETVTNGWLAKKEITWRWLVTEEITWRWLAKEEITWRWLATEEITWRWLAKEEIPWRWLATEESFKWRRWLVETQVINRWHWLAKMSSVRRWSQLAAQHRRWEKICKICRPWCWFQIWRTPEKLP